MMRRHSSHSGWQFLSLPSRQNLKRSAGLLGTLLEDTNCLFM